MTEIAKIAEMNVYSAYTDGSCNNLSPHGEGGAAYIILQHGAEVKRASKGFMHTSNNRMELLAIISAVNSVPEGATIVVHTDSQYSIMVLSPDYKIKPMTKNSDLIRLFAEIAKNRNVQFTWVKGHNGNPFNELADQLADAKKEEMRITHNIPIYNRFTSPKCK